LLVPANGTHFLGGKGTHKYASAFPKISTLTLLNEYGVFTIHNCFARLRLRSDKVGFVVNNLALVRVLSEYIGFPYHFSFHKLLNIH
jgi:hypothetical protein